MKKIDTDCQRAREAASARLDGEDPSLPVAALDHHLATCHACRQWLVHATTVTRALRLHTVDVPDLSAQITATAARPTRRRRHRLTALRAGLLLLGLSQVALAVPDLFGDSMGMAMSLHAAHESAAWNVAVGVAFAAAAVRPRRISGLVPMLIAFVAVLALLSIHDLQQGVVEPARLLTHLACVFGLALLLLLARATRVDQDSPLLATRPDDADSDATHRGLRGVA